MCLELFSFFFLSLSKYLWDPAMGQALFQGMGDSAVNKEKNPCYQLLVKATEYLASFVEIQIWGPRPKILIQ